MKNATPSRSPNRAGDTFISAGGARPHTGVDSLSAGRAWRNGRRSGLKIRFSQGSVGSIPTARTREYSKPYKSMITG